jgi:hypothetical protein
MGACVCALPVWWMWRGWQILSNPFSSLPKETKQLFLSDGSLTDSCSYEVFDRCGSSLSLARQLFIPILYRTYYDSPDRDIIIERVKSAHSKWLEAPTYNTFKNTLPDGTTELVGGKARKRGNDIDQWRKKNGWMKERQISLRIWFLRDLNMPRSCVIPSSLR